MAYKSYLEGYFKIISVPENREVFVMWGSLDKTHEFGTAKGGET